MEATTLQRSWSSVANGWEVHADFVDARAAAMTQALLRLAGVGPGSRVLELACGAGGLGLAAASLVGPAGEVVVSDVAPEMTAIAERRADAHGIAGVTTRELDLERIDEPDASFDAVLCREGLMLVRDPARAAAEIRRVLRPGGRVAVSVWGPRVRNPWLGIVFDAVGAQLGVPVPPPGIPGPFSLGDADRLAHVLAAGGLSGVEVTELAVPYRAGSVGEWLGRTVDLAGPLAHRIAGLTEPAKRAILIRAGAAVAPYETADGLDIPGVALLAAATRA